MQRALVDSVSHNDQSCLMPTQVEHTVCIITAELEEGVSFFSNSKEALLGKYLVGLHQKGILELRCNGARTFKNLLKVFSELEFSLSRKVEEIGTKWRMRCIHFPSKSSLLNFSHKKEAFEPRILNFPLFSCFVYRFSVLAKIRLNNKK